MPLTVPVAPWSRCLGAGLAGYSPVVGGRWHHGGGRWQVVGGRWRHLLPVALWLRMRSVTRENSAASTVPSPLRSNILKAIWGGFP